MRMCACVQDGILNTKNTFICPKTPPPFAISPFPFLLFYLPPPVVSVLFLREHPLLLSFLLPSLFLLPPSIKEFVFKNVCLCLCVCVRVREGACTPASKETERLSKHTHTHIHIYIWICSEGVYIKRARPAEP